MIKILWLDDLRNPFLDIEGRVPKETGEIHWVLNYEQFVQWIQKFGLPDIISFDHDLGDKERFFIPEIQEMTGKDCANWLVEYCMDNNLELPKYYVHSANPVGADNIIGLLQNFKNKR